MAIILMLIAALSVGIANFCMRKSVDAGGTTRGFLVLQLLLSCLTVILLNPVRTGNYTWAWTPALVGWAGGLILGIMMLTIGRAIEHGPAGLSFAILNCATVIPAIVMVALFGVPFGHDYTLFNAIGSLLVVIALVWAGWEQKTRPGHKGKWLFFSFTALCCNALFMIFMQWRTLQISTAHPVSLLLPFDLPESQSQWLIPAIFSMATLIQLIAYLSKEKRFPNPRETLYGIIGGLLNGCTLFIMFKATEVATPWEQAMIFPIFSVGVIIACNIWGRWLYQEKVNWLASSVAVLGIIVGTVHWAQLLKA